MGLSCECDYDFVAEFQSETYRKARKQHKCSECYQVIQVGAEYLRVTGKYDGEFDSFCICVRCDGVQLALSDLGYCMSRGTLVEDYQEYLEMIGSKKTAKEILCRP